ncbi:unnamed protein product [Auanema sp. JU1783]|nr:unnamed protein product [Auanema sp. JU1783]
MEVYFLADSRFLLTTCDGPWDFHNINTRGLYNILINNELNIILFTAIEVQVVLLDPLYYFCDSVVL